MIERAALKTLLGLSVAASMLLGGSAALADHSQAVNPPSPASGPAQVIATWLLDLGDVPYWWNVAEYQVDPAGTPLPAIDPTFLVGTGDRSVVITSSDLRVLLADGEAVFLRPQSAATATPVGTEAAILTALALSTTATQNSSARLDPGEGTHDVDLLRSTLDAGETLALRADIPAFVLVTAGSVTGADGATVAAGSWATLGGDISLTNSGSDPAIVLVAIIGPVLQLQLPSATSTTSTTVAPTTTTSTTSTTTSSSTTSTTEQTTSSTTEPPTTVTAPPQTEPPGSAPQGSQPPGSQP